MKSRWIIETVNAYHHNVSGNQPTVASVYTGCPGLAVHPITNGSQSWVVTHTASGMTAGTTGTEKRAKAAVVALAGAGIDWTLDEDSLRASCDKLGRLVFSAMNTGRCPQFRQQNLFPKYQQTN